jgi:hypothetical protein
MKKIQRKYNIGGLVQSYASPQIVEGIGSVTSQFAKGGKMGFDVLAKKVAKNYEGKRVPKEYQKDYGKVYSKEEAKEVGNKVASKVYRQQLAKKMANGGMLTQKDSYEIGDKIRFIDSFRKEEKDGTIYQINEVGTYVVNYGSGITAGIRGVEEKDIVGVYPKEEPKKKRFGFFDVGGEIGFIPMDLEEKIALLAKWGGTNLRGVIGLLNAMIDTGITDEDLKYTAKKETRFQREKAVEKKIDEIWSRIQPNYNQELKGNMYYSTLNELISRNGIYENLLKKFKPFRKYQKFAEGGLAKVEIVNEGEVFDDKKYTAILGDFDFDGLPNVDDLEPLNKSNSKQIEQLKFSNTFKELLETKKDLDIDMDKFVTKLRQSAPKESKIYART